jgi:hypothetical protein
MRRIVTVLSAACMLLGAGVYVAAQAADEVKAKYDIKAVMKEAHGQKLRDKIIAGNATREDKEKLLDLYLSLLENKPPKGEDAAWHAKAGAVVAAAAKVVVGREGAVEELKTATNCAACHKEHKGA